MNPIKTVLISGASIAGPMLAYWLSRTGFAPTIVERWPSLRTGGHAVDFRGTAMEVVRRMGLADSIKAAAGMSVPRTLANEIPAGHDA